MRFVLNMEITQMRIVAVLLLAAISCPWTISDGAETRPNDKRPAEDRLETTRLGLVGKPGQVAKYRHVRSGAIAGSVVETFTLVSGPVEKSQDMESQWLCLRATKADGKCFTVWLLGHGYPVERLAAARKTTTRYILQQGESMPLEFRDRTTNGAVLPVLGGWKHLFPRAESVPSGAGFPRKTKLLGHTYQLDGVEDSGGSAKPPKTKVLELRPDVLMGFPHNTKQKDETRRYDRSDYELIALTQDDYREIVDAGINCLRVDAEQAGWVDHLNVFYWGPGGAEVSYPECLYRSNYLGPALFLDEPAVVTRDHVVRPKLREDPGLRRTLTPERVLEDFRDHFRKAKNQGAPAGLLKGLAARPDVDLGDMQFLQQNIYSWETMVSSAIHQLAEGAEGPPAAIVFEPPGRFGTRRTLPEMNMTYGCQIPVDDPKNLIEIIYGFLRGAARLTGKEWGMSIYGAVDRADTFWFQTHAYDLGATHFFYWDSFELACVPYGECLALSRNLSAHAASHPDRDLERLKRAAEVAILLPPGYNLGHVSMGKGSFWGLAELNLERLNRKGVKYRKVMSNFFAEIERCIRLGVAYDLFWNSNELDLNGYREIIRVREDGKLELGAKGQTRLLDGPRTPLRPSGIGPKLTVELSANVGKAPESLTANARITEGSAPIFYTLGTDTRGRYSNVMVAWELYGPEEEDYRFLRQQEGEPHIRQDGSETTAEIAFRIEQPGNYRLRAATVDMSGRTDVVWKRITID
jgi:hypothetical protein